MLNFVYAKHLLRLKLKNITFLDLQSSVVCNCGSILIHHKVFSALKWDF